MATSRVLRRLGLIATGSLLALALLPGTMLAGGPEYAISVTKTASPTSLAAKGSVTFTIKVENTGSGFFQGVNVSDSNASCAPSLTGGDDGDGKLEEGETWTYTCTYDVTPPATNTVTVNACHDKSTDQCNNANHDATDSASATVSKSGGTTATLPPTDAISGTSGTADSIGLVLLALAGVLASVMILTPARLRRR
jgi:hypothetical protein